MLLSSFIWTSVQIGIEETLKAKSTILQIQTDTNERKFSIKMFVTSHQFCKHVFEIQNQNEKKEKPNECAQWAKNDNNKISFFFSFLFSHKWISMVLATVCIANISDLRCHSFKWWCVQCSNCRLIVHVWHRQCHLGTNIIALLNRCVRNLSKTCVNSQDVDEKKGAAD